MKIDDEIINKYLDNDLSGAELVEFTKVLSEDPYALRNLKLYKFIEIKIPNLIIYPAPTGISEFVMNRITERVSLKYQKNSFFYYVISFFSAAIIALLGFAFYSDNKIESGKNYFDQGIAFVSKNLPPLKNTAFTNETMLIVGAGLTLLFLFSGFFLFDSHKSIKNKIENYGK